MTNFMLLGLLRTAVNVRYWHLADIPSCTAHAPLSGVKRKAFKLNVHIAEQGLLNKASY